LIYLDTLIQKIYEDKVSGTLKEKRFAVLSKQYETEQETLETRISEAEKELAVFAEDGKRADKFIALVRRYTDFEELTPKMLHEYISKIVVHEAKLPYLVVAENWGQLGPASRWSGNSRRPVVSRRSRSISRRRTSVRSMRGSIISKTRVRFSPGALNAMPPRKPRSPNRPKNQRRK
jgi:hypothetical protein